VAGGVEEAVQDHQLALEEALVVREGGEVPLAELGDESGRWDAAAWRAGGAVGSGGALNVLLLTS